MSDMTTIVKIKRDSGIEIHAKLELAEGRGTKATVLKCNDEPLASFDKAMNALEVHVRAILQLDPAQWKGDLSIAGVTWSGENVTVTASVDLSVGALPINTPSMPFAHLAPVMQQAVEKVREEAQLYLDGKRRGDLFAKAA